MEYVLRTFNLCKQIKGRQIINNLNMNVRKGEIYGFLGRNGSGKTTTIRLIMQLFKASSGTVEYCGQPMTNKSYEIFKKIGSIIEYPAFYEKLTARENLEIHKTLMGFHDKNCIEDAISMVKLENFENKRVGEFSLGMKQKLGIARAIMTKPELLILDEPINGLDPIAIKDIRLLLKELSQKYGMTIIISSHILSEIEQIADTIGIINNGTMIEEIDYEKIKEKNRQYIAVEVDDAKKAGFILTEKMHISNFTLDGEKTLKIYEKLDDAGSINSILVENGVKLNGLSVKNDSLEDYFISIVGGDNNDDKLN